MSDRVKILGVFAILGFFAGVIANFSYRYVLPVIFAVFPEILSIEWVLSGIAGAVLTVFVMVAWAYASRSPEA